MACQGLRPFQVGDFRCYVRACKSRDQFPMTSGLPRLFCFWRLRGMDYEEAFTQYFYRFLLKALFGNALFCKKAILGYSRSIKASRHL